MQRYSVLLVDDEEDVIQVIMKKIDWESMGFTGQSAMPIMGWRHWRWQRNVFRMLS